MSDKKPEAEAQAKAAAGGPAGDAGKGGSEGGLKSWLPLIVTIVLMPVLAFATTKFLILPKVVQAREGAAGEEGHEEAAAESGHGGEKAAKDGKESKDHGTPKEGKEAPKDAHGKTAGKKKQSAPISKVIVNVAGSMGTRYLMTSFTLVGTANDFKSTIEETKDQLLDLANTAMASKTIGDLEKPGARNQIRSELISIFNNALGGNLVQEIYFTEFAVQ
jgi:flagellar FliL protein